MADVALVWYVMPDDTPRATKTLVRDVAARFGMTDPVGMKSSATVALRKAAELTVVEYTDDGKQHAITARQTAHSEEFETFTVYSRAREGGVERRVAEVKLFANRRTKKGIVANSERLKTLIGKTGSPATREAANEWVREFLGHYDGANSYVSLLNIRRMVRLHFLRYCIPTSKHKYGIYFCYVEDLAEVRKAEEFLLAVAPGTTFTVLPIESGPEQHALFAQAADEHVELLLDGLLGRRTAFDRDSRRTPAYQAWAGDIDGVARQLERHEMRLGVQLPRTRARMAEVLQPMGPWTQRATC